MAVYPRWRGEHERIYLKLFEHHGLSPLARGTLLINRVTDEFGRFIPAGAGNTSSTISCGEPYPVYPRWRGEHADVIPVFGVNVGLSPLARGTPSTPQKWISNPRFIPAGAGNTTSQMC